MFISPIIGNRFNSNQYNSVTSAQTRPFALQNDVFIKNQPVFMSTSAGKPLKKLNNLTDPVFGIKLINEKVWSEIESYINTNPGIKETIKFLRLFAKNNYMLKIEESIYNDLAKAIRQNPALDFQDCMKMWYDKALIKLWLEEFNVLDKIDQLSKTLTPETMLEVRKQVTHCRQVIHDNDPMKPFKRKTVLESLGKIEPLPGEEKTLFELKELAKDLPTSGTSKNAFIVKYANRSQNEIAKRLLRMSLLTIDHTFADSLGGENALYNFAAMSALANSLKGDESLYRFAIRFPSIRKNYQKYMNDIIFIINHGGLKGYETYPYEHAKWVEEQSKGLIKLDIKTRYKYTEKQAREAEEKYLNEQMKKRKAYMA